MDGPESLPILVQFDFFSKLSYTRWRFPKIMGTILGVPIIRTIVFGGLYWGPPILGNYHIYTRHLRPHVFVTSPYMPPKKLVCISLSFCRFHLILHSWGQVPKPLALLPKPLTLHIPVEPHIPLYNRIGNCIGPCTTTRPRRLLDFSESLVMARVRF